MDPFDDDNNGILAQIPGDYVARAADTLPPAIADEDTHAVVVIGVPGLGRVRIKFQLLSSSHGRWFWTATHAELA